MVYCCLGLPPLLTSIPMDWPERLTTGVDPTGEVRANVSFGPDGTPLAADQSTPSSTNIQPPNTTGAMVAGGAGVSADDPSAANAKQQQGGSRTAGYVIALAVTLPVILVACAAIWWAVSRRTSNYSSWLGGSGGNEGTRRDSGGDEEEGLTWRNGAGPMLNSPSNRIISRGLQRLGFVKQQQQPFNGSHQPLLLPLTATAAAAVDRSSRYVVKVATASDGTAAAKGPAGRRGFGAPLGEALDSEDVLRLSEGTTAVWRSTKFETMPEIKLPLLLAASRSARGKSAAAAGSKGCSSRGGHCKGPGCCEGSSHCSGTAFLQNGSSSFTTSSMGVAKAGRRSRMRRDQLERCSVDSWEGFGLGRQWHTWGGKLHEDAFAADMLDPFYIENTAVRRFTAMGTTTRLSADLGALGVSAGQQGESAAGQDWMEAPLRSLGVRGSVPIHLSQALDWPAGGGQSPSGGNTGVLGSLAAGNPHLAGGILSLPGLSPIELNVDFKEEIEPNLGRLLGKGGYGHVYEAMWRGEKVSKRVSTSGLSVLGGWLSCSCSKAFAK